MKKKIKPFQIRPKSLDHICNLNSSPFSLSNALLNLITLAQNPHVYTWGEKNKDYMHLHKICLGYCCCCLITKL